MRIPIAALIIATASPAAAGCITHDGSARAAANVFATSRVCTGMVAIKNEHMMDIAVLFMAVDKSQIGTTSCKLLVSNTFHARWGDLAGRPPAIRNKVCAKFVAYLRGSYLAKPLRLLDVLR